MSLGAAVLQNGLPDPTLPIPGSVQVVESLHRPTTYRLRYEFNSADGDFPLLVEDRLGPESELAVMVMVDTTPKFLVNGPVTRQEITVLNGGQGSTLDVIGGDPSIAMDREDKAKVWSNVTDSLAVTAVLADYKLAPDVTPTTTLHTELKHVLVQRETDLRFVRRLARRNGFWFWITSEAPGIDVGHFKRPDFAGPPDVELKLNVGEPNVDKVTLEWDTERPVQASLKQLNLSDKSVIDGSVRRSPLSGLAEKALADVITKCRQTHLVVPVDDAGDLTARAEAVLIDAGWFVSARVSVRLSVLKKLVRTHMLARLIGLGSRHSGTYVVSQVIHDIDPNEHLMTIDLARNGWN